MDGNETKLTEALSAYATRTMMFYVRTIMYSAWRTQQNWLMLKSEQKKLLNATEEVLRVAIKMYDQEQAPWE